LTIAALYVSPEGVVLGADSTSSFFNSSHIHYFNYAQKVFEVGEKSEFGLLTWGMGGLDNVSYRTALAQLADQLAAHPPAGVQAVADAWVAHFDAKYQALPAVQRAQLLAGKPAHDPAAQATTRTPAEEEELGNLCSSLVVGFCIAGYVLPGREPDAWIMVFQPTSQPTVIRAEKNELHCWGMPHVMNRLLYGVDDAIVDSIVASGKWNDTPNMLVQILEEHRLNPRAYLPLRDAVDYVHSAIYCTIKAMKFSTRPQVCGGPIEIAVISSDRKFRWVRHKEWDAAIEEGAM
jgi:hypothetical protein